MSNPKRCSKYALIIDDEPQVLQEVGDVVGECGLGVVGAVGALEARTRMRFQRFDLIITDIVMPKENGLQFLVSLHKGAVEGMQREVPPVVVLTNFEMNEQLKEKLTKYLRVELILKKPLQKAVLKDFIDRRFSPQKKRPHGFDVDLMNKFLKATMEIIELNSEVRPTSGRASVRRDGRALGEFTGIIELTSPRQRGFVALSFERACIEELSKHILLDSTVQITDSILRDVAGEMCNQVAGNAQGQFHKEGQAFEISTPTIVSGTKYRIDHHLSAPCVVIPFHWNEHAFYTQFVMDARDDAPENSDDEEDCQDGVLERGEVKYLNG